MNFVVYYHDLVVVALFLSLSSFSVRSARLRSWTLILYGTERYPYSDPSSPSSSRSDKSSSNPLPTKRPRNKHKPSHRHINPDSIRGKTGSAHSPFRGVGRNVSKSGGSKPRNQNDPMSPTSKGKDIRIYSTLLFLFLLFPIIACHLQDPQVNPRKLRIIKLHEIYHYAQIH